MERDFSWVPRQDGTQVSPGTDNRTFAPGRWVALHAYEIIWWREARARTRALRLPAS